MEKQKREKLKRIKELVLSDLKMIFVPAIVILVYFIAADLVFHTSCPFAIMTGLPCPGCGITRAALLVLQFRFADAARMNFTVYLWIAVAVFFVINRYFLEKKEFPFWIFIPVGIAMLGLWLYRMVNVFPGPAPMEYREYNVISLIIGLLTGKGE